MGTVLERPVSYVAQSPEAFREVLGQFIQSVWQLDAVCELFAEIAAGSSKNRLDHCRSLGSPCGGSGNLHAQFAGALRPLASNHRCLQCG